MAADEGKAICPNSWSLQIAKPGYAPGYLNMRVLPPCDQMPDAMSRDWLLRVGLSVSWGISYIQPPAAASVRHWNFERSKDGTGFSSKFSRTH